MENILKIDKIEKYYGNKSSLTKAIDNISFEVEKGEFVAIMGASGSGKTTLLNCISTIDKVTSGHIYVAENDITKLKGNSLNEFRREELGFIFQDFNLLDTLTAYENIALALSIQNISAKKIDERIKKIARELNITEILEKYPYQMSGGQKQRVASARAIITNPKLILADEPTGALDSKSSKMLLEQFEYLNKTINATILMVTHDAFTASYATRVIFIKDGKIFNEIHKGTDTITICVLSTSLSMKSSLNKNLSMYAPLDIEIGKNYNTDQIKYDYTDIQMKNSKLSFEEALNELGFDYKNNLTNITNISLYKDENITLKSSLGSYYEIAKNQKGFLSYNKTIKLMKNSDYNNIANSFNLEKVDLKDNEYIVVGNYENMLSIKNEALKRNTKIEINNKDYYPKYEKAIHGFYEMTSNESEDGFIVLPDNALKDEQKVTSLMIADYKGDKNQIESMINNIIKKENFADYILTINTKQDIKNASVGLGAIVTFLGLYLGIIFLISCAAIIALKELSESSDNSEKFNMLRKIGVDEKDLNKALFRQIGVFFIFPLALAIIHSIFGLMFCNNIIKTAGVSFNLQSIIITAIFIVLIYGGYFLVTYLCSKNIIKENK